MSQYQQDYSYTQVQYQVVQWQGVLGALMGVAVLIAMAAWAFSLVKKAFRGEEVGFPL